MYNSCDSWNVKCLGCHRLSWNSKISKDSVGLSVWSTHRADPEDDEAEDCPDQIKDSPDHVVQKFQSGVVRSELGLEDVGCGAEVEHEQQGAEYHGGPEGKVEQTLGQATRVLVNHATDDAAKLEMKLKEKCQKCQIL